MTTGMDKKNYQMPSEVTEERHDDAVNSTEPDLTSYYEAAAAAASSGHEFHPDGDREHTEVPPEGNLHEKNEELSDGTDRPTDGNLPDVSEDGSPHGPLALFSDEEKNGEQAAAEENGPAHPQEGVPAYAAFQAPENAEEQEDEDDGQEGAEDDAPMSIMGHLNELRRRLFRIVIIVILGFVAFYGISEPLYGFLSAPLKACMPEGSKLIYTSPQGAFFTYMKVALVASLFGTSPFSFYQLWAFIAPGLYREEKRAVLPLAFFPRYFSGRSIVLFFPGISHRLPVLHGICHRNHRTHDLGRGVSQFRAQTPHRFRPGVRNAVVRVLPVPFRPPYAGIHASFTAVCHSGHLHRCGYSHSPRCVLSMPYGHAHACAL